MECLKCEFNEDQKWLFMVLVSSHSFCKILNGFIIKCETKAAIVHNFEVYSFMRDIYQIGEILSDLSTYRSRIFFTHVKFYLDTPLHAWWGEGGVQNVGPNFYCFHLKFL